MTITMTIKDSDVPWESSTTELIFDRTYDRELDGTFDGELDGMFFLTMDDRQSNSQPNFLFSTFFN